MSEWLQKPARRRIMEGERVTHKQWNMITAKGGKKVCNSTFFFSFLNNSCPISPLVRLPPPPSSAPGERPMGESAEAG